VAGGAARLRELRLISALLASGDARRALEQVRAAAEVLSRRRSPAEQLTLPSLPAPPSEPRPVTAVTVRIRAAKRPCACEARRPAVHDTRKATLERRVGLREGREHYDSPDDRVAEAVFAWADYDGDEAGYHAARERFWRAVLHHPRVKKVAGGA